MYLISLLKFCRQSTAVCRDQRRLFVLQGPEDSLVHQALKVCLELWAHQVLHLLLMASLLPDTVKPLKNHRVHLEQG